MNRSLYPAKWNEIATAIKEGAGWHCEECKKPCRRLGESWPDFVGRVLAEYGPNEWYEETWQKKPTKFTLTVAHLDHNPQNCDRANLKAMCAPCHLRYDAVLHAKNARATRAKKQKSLGQLSLLEG
jgi:hypothetical protein